MAGVSRELGRGVAIKFSSPSVVENAQVVARFSRRRAHGLLNHPIS